MKPPPSPSLEQCIARIAYTMKMDIHIGAINGSMFAPMILSFSVNLGGRKMAIRPIDAVQVLHNINLHHIQTPMNEFEFGFNNGLNQAMWEITNAPTLTQPNEGAKDKNVPTNEPLTLEELRLIAEPTPVWWDWVQGWVLARKGMIMSWNGRYHNSGELRGDFYRRPPEGEEEI